MDAPRRGGLPRMRVLLAVVLASCATQRVNVETLVARADVNEVAAVNSVRSARVSATGEILEIGFYSSEHLSTSTRGSLSNFGWVGSSTTTRVREGIPVVRLRAEDGTVVLCFLTVEAAETPERFEKGRRTKVAGGFYSFVREATGRTQVWLKSCDLDGPA